MDKLKEWPYLVFGQGPKGSYAHCCSTLEAAVERKLHLQRQGCTGIFICLIFEDWSATENDGQSHSLFGKEVDE